VRLGQQQILAGASAAVVVFLVLVAAYLIARAPDDILGSGAPAGQPGTPSTETVRYTVRPDASASEIGRELADLGIIRSGEQFELLVKLMGLEGSLSAGEYELRRGASVVDVITAVTVTEAVPVLRVTFPEGIRFEEMAELAEAAGFGTKQDFLDAVAAATVPPDIAASLPAGADLQGYIFPDTYILPEGSTAADLVQLCLDTFLDRVTPELRAAIASRGLTLHQGITLAAIVEREAVLAEERPLIAGVFYNRLERQDKLGADPTVQFAVAEDPASVAQYGWWKQELTILDYEDASPYNTYLIVGLPPGPITNPGLASIEAVGFPADTEMYYFVANAKEGDGSHVFAETLDEHERNRVLYGP
jgi:UPF0755 protein